MEAAVADVHVSCRVGDNDEIPVVKGIVTAAARDADADVHDLCEEPQVVPVVVGEPGRHAAAVHGPRRHVLIDGDPAAREEDAQLVARALPDVDVVFGAIAASAVRDRDFVPDLRLRRAKILLPGTRPSGFLQMCHSRSGARRKQKNRRFLPQFVNAFCDGFLYQISDADHPVFGF